MARSSKPGRPAGGAGESSTGDERRRARLEERERQADERDRIADEELPQTLVERDAVDVMFKRGADNQPAITRVWTELEQALESLKGRKFYGVFDPASREYRACVEIKDGDDAEALGLEHGRLAGGRYARVRLTGEPPAVYAEIRPASKRLAQRPDADRQAPSIEFYRRRDVIDLLQPLV